MVAAYRQDPDVEYAEPNFIAHAHLIPNDALYYVQWNFDNPVYGCLPLPLKDRKNENE